MKNQSAACPAAPVTAPTEDDIRDYAYHLYQQSNYMPGQDLGNWLEATACLQANIPSHQSGTRLHRHVNAAEAGELAALSLAARNSAN